MGVEIMATVMMNEPDTQTPILALGTFELGNFPVAHYRIEEYGNEIDLKLVHFYIYWTDESAKRIHLEEVVEIIKDIEKYKDWALGVKHFFPPNNTTIIQEPETF